MSIITDALKKAEYERELKTKRAQEEVAQATLEETKSQESVSVLTDPVVSESFKSMVWPEKNEFRDQKRSSFLSFQPREVLILVGILLALLLVLLLLPRWPSSGKNFSVVWRPADRGSFFQVSPVGGSFRPGASVPSLPTRGFEDNGFVKLPFSLSGISASGNNRLAIVNNRIVQEGDGIDGAHVKQILDREVIIETRSGEVKLKLQS